MSALQNIRLVFKQADHLIKLIYINIGVFLILKLLAILFILFNKQIHLLTWLAVPADLNQLLYRFWTPVSYMFLHTEFFHLLFNLLCLYWFGRIFLSVFSQKQLVGLYLIGGIFAASFYIAAYNLFPYYERLVGGSLLLGASGSIMAITVAVAMRLPHLEVRLLFLGNIKLKYLAAVAVIISFLKITDSNAGGELAHLGGALMGYLYVVFFNKGIDLSSKLNQLIDSVVNIFRRPKMRVKKTKGYDKNYRKMTDQEYNMHKEDTMKEVDRILDKIKDSGYDSLSEKEKTQLFQQGKK